MFQVRCVVAVMLVSISSFAFAGDCSKTVMGGGCSADIDQGTAPHMRAQAKKNSELPVATQEAKITKMRVASTQK